MDGKDKPSTCLEVGEFELTHQHRLQNRPYPYPRHINRFESQSHRGNRLFNTQNPLNSCPIPKTKKSAEAEKTLGQQFNDYCISC